MTIIFAFQNSFFFSTKMCEWHQSNIWRVTLDYLWFSDAKSYFELLKASSKYSFVFI